MATLQQLQQAAADALKNYNSAVIAQNGFYETMRALFNNDGNIGSSCYNTQPNFETQIRDFGTLNPKSCKSQWPNGDTCPACKSTVDEFNNNYTQWIAAKNNVAILKGILDSANFAVANFEKTDPVTLTADKNRRTRNGVIIAIVIAAIAATFYYLYKKFGK